MRVTLLLLILFVASPAAGGAVEEFPLYNADFAIPVPPPLHEPMPLGELLFDSTGSVAPGLSDRDARRPAAGWTHRAISTRGLTYGSAHWLESEAVHIDVDPRDTGPSTAVLAQAMGSAGRAGFWRDPDAVVITLLSVCDAPLTVRGLYRALEGQHEMRSTAALRVEPTDTGELRLPWETNPTGRMTDLLIAFESIEGRPSCIALDAVRLEGGRFDLGIQLP